MSSAIYFTLSKDCPAYSMASSSGKRKMRVSCSAFDNDDNLHLFAIRKIQQSSRVPLLQAPKTSQSDCCPCICSRGYVDVVLPLKLSEDAVTTNNLVSLSVQSVIKRCGFTPSSFYQALEDDKLILLIETRAVSYRAYKYLNEIRGLQKDIKEAILAKIAENWEAWKESQDPVHLSLELGPDRKKFVIDYFPKGQSIFCSYLKEDQFVALDLSGQFPNARVIVTDDPDIIRSAENANFNKPGLLEVYKISSDGLGGKKWIYTKSWDAPLEAALDARGHSLNQWQRWKIACDILEGFSVLHDLNWVYPNLKTSDIFVSFGGNCGAVIGHLHQAISSSSKQDDIKTPPPSQDIANLADIFQKLFPFTYATTHAKLLEKMRNGSWSALQALNELKMKEPAAGNPKGRIKV